MIRASLLIALGFLSGCAYWAFITWKTGLVGDDDEQMYGRQS